jgi:hypothetical protein
MEECMQLIQASLPYEGSRSPNTPITDAALPPSPLKLPNKKVNMIVDSQSYTNIAKYSRMFKLYGKNIIYLIYYYVIVI